VYVGSDDGVLYALAREDGSERWRVATDGRISAAAAVGDGTVYVGSRDENLYAVSAADGSVRWTFDTGGAVDAAPTVVDGTVYVGCTDGVFAVSVVDGTQQWSIDAEVGYTSAIAVAEETVYAVDNGYLIALQRSDGTPRWELFLEDAIGRQIPSVAGGTVYIGNDDGDVYAVSAVDGTRRWLFETDGSVQAAPSVADGTVYVGNHEGEFYALDAADGTEQWTFGTGDRISSASVAHETVYLATEAGNRVVALSASDGSVRWERRTGDYMVSAPAVANETVYVGCGNRVCALSSDTATTTGTETRTRSPTEVVDGEETRSETPIPTVTPVVTEPGDQGGIDLLPAAIGLAGLGGLGGAGAWWLTRSDDTGENDGPTDAGESADSGERPGSAGGDLSSSQSSGPSGGVDVTAPTAVTSQRAVADERIPRDIPRAPHVTVEYETLEDEEPIGGGGHADVTRTTVSTSDVDVTVALKEPRLSGTLHSDRVERLLEEAQTWAQLDGHDHIVGVVDYGSEPIPWIAMEYMDGGDLGERIGDLDLPQALWTALAVTRGVRHAHTRGVAHLDLKPENVLFRTVEGAWDVPKVADWGLSKHLLEHSKSVEGISPHYAAPEQFEPEYGPTDNVTDVYQLGAVFYELFTGRPPFEGRPTEVMRAALTEEPTPPSEITDVPEALDDLLLTALARERDDRYDDVVYLRDGLVQLFDDR
jgi:outer membrane protein assembly factor BamB